MALTREQKKQKVVEAGAALHGAVSVVFMAFDGVTVEDMEELRDNLFAVGCAVKVVPKRLLKIAAQTTKVDFDPTIAEGQVAIVWGNDAVAPAKALYAFAKKRENVRLLAGVLEGQTLSFDQVTSLAQLPGKQELLGQLVSVLAGPLRGLQGVLSGSARQFVYVLTAIKDQGAKV